MGISPSPQEFWDFEGFKFYPWKGEVHYNGEVRRLPDIPCRLLAHLLASSPEPVTWSQLIEPVWGVKQKDEATVRGAVLQVRKVLHPREDLLRVGRDGYYLAATVVRRQSDGIVLESGVKVGELDLHISATIHEMTIGGWATNAIEWLADKISELPLGSRRIKVLLYLWLSHLTRADLETARSYAERCLQLANDAGDPLLKVASLAGLSVTFTHLGRLREASAQLRDAVKLLSESKRIFVEEDRYIVEPGSAVHCQEALLAWFFGYPQKALTKLEQARQSAEKFNHPQTTCLVLVYSAWVHQLRGEPERTQVYASEAIVLSEKHDLRQLQPWGMILGGWAKSELHQAGEGIEQMHESLKQQEKMRSMISRTYFLVLLAEALPRDGAATLSALDEAARTAEANQEKFFEAEIHRVRGEILAASCGQLDEAVACFRRSIEIARSQDARALELRAQMAWSRLVANDAVRLISEGQQARTMLREVYDSFSEGHETKDLQEAQILLEKLS